jgi:hypothetical protein
LVQGRCSDLVQSRDNPAHGPRHRVSRHDQCTLRQAEHAIDMTHGRHSMYALDMEYARRSNLPLHCALPLPICALICACAHVVQLRDGGSSISRVAHDSNGRWYFDRRPTDHNGKPGMRRTPVSTRVNRSTVATSPTIDTPHTPDARRGTSV